MKFPVTIAISILGLVCPAFSQQSEDPPDPVLVSLRTRFERELGGLEPVPTFTPETLPAPASAFPSPAADSPATA